MTPHRGVSFSLARQDHGGRRRRIQAAQRGHPQSACRHRQIALGKIADIGQGADDNQGEPGLAGCDTREARHGHGRQQRQDQARQDEKLAGGHDFLHFDAAGQLVQPLTAGEEQHRDHRRPDRDPVGQRQRDGPQEIGVHIQQQHHQPDIRLSVLVTLSDVLTIKHEEPRSEQHEAPGEGDEPVPIKEVQHPASEREHRERADAARACRAGVREDILKGQPEKEAQSEHQTLVCGGGGDAHAETLRRAPVPSEGGVS
jgi:hypothetical protein